MSYPYGKGCSTPLPKGLLEYCPTCVYYIEQEPDQPKIKYPCTKSHQQVRKAAGINYARDFVRCELYQGGGIVENVAQYIGETHTSDYDILCCIKKQFDKEYEAEFITTHSVAGKELL